MKFAGSSKQLAVRGIRKYILFCLLLTAYCSLSCSIPNLEKPQCTAARDTVKRFYSFHFGNDMRPSPEGLNARKEFLTSELFKELSVSNVSDTDYFTASDNYPRAFRVGECKVSSDDRTAFGVMMLWRDENSSDQKVINVETALVDGKWLINKVSN
ncbi:hypothetical protein BH10ACI3_BH10ACI3_04900 [soil metagenome]